MKKQRKEMVVAWKITWVAPFVVFVCVVIIFASMMQRTENNVYISVHKSGVRSIPSFEMTTDVADRVRSHTGLDGQPETINLPETSLKVINP